MKFKVYALLSNFTAFVPKYLLKYYMLQIHFQVKSVFHENIQFI